MRQTIFLSIVADIDIYISGLETISVVCTLSLIILFVVSIALVGTSSFLVRTKNRSFSKLMSKNSTIASVTVTVSFSNYQ